VIRAEDAGVPAAELRAGGKAVGARHNMVGAGYFRTLGLAMKRGREFTAADTQAPSAPRVAVINEALARRLWPNGDALGKQIHFLSDGESPRKAPMEVVGIAPDIRASLFEPESSEQVYAAFGQAFQSNANIHLRLAPGAAGGGSALLQSVRREIRAFDENLPVLSLKTMRGHFDTSVELWLLRVAARMFAAFGAVAMFLAVVGVYGVRAYVVARRTREIGVRMAMGATTGDTMRMVVREGLLLTAIGVLIGWALALGVGRLLSSLLYRVSPTDPVVFLATPLILTAAGLLASYFPARRAARVDPMAALRCE
jgi:predicted permease